MSFLQLIAMPIVAAWLALQAPLPPVAAGVVLLFSATPAGANVFCLRAVTTASSTQQLAVSHWDRFAMLRQRQ